MYMSQLGYHARDIQRKICMGNFFKNPDNHGIGKTCYFLFLNIFQNLGKFCDEI